MQEWKQLMSNKEIIIPILRMTVPEFKTCSQEILQCLEHFFYYKDDFVSDTSNVEKDLRLTKKTVNSLISCGETGEV